MHGFCNIAKDGIPNHVHWNRLQLPSDLFVQVVPKNYLWWCNKYSSSTQQACFTIENGSLILELALTQYSSVGIIQFSTDESLKLLGA